MVMTASPMRCCPISNQAPWAAIRASSSPTLRKVFHRIDMTVSSLHRNRHLHQRVDRAAHLHGAGLVHHYLLRFARFLGAGVEAGGPFAADVMDGELLSVGEGDAVAPIDGEVGNRELLVH